MVIEIRKRALNALSRTAAYIDSRNTPGSGDRWLDKVKSEIYSLAKHKVKLGFCKNSSLAKFHYRCFFFNDWVIAYRITEKKFEVSRFI
jgi:hypothetical protein